MSLFDDLTYKQSYWTDERLKAVKAAVDIASFSKFTIPLMKRVYPSLIAEKLVAVQPLLGPSFPLNGEIFKPPKKKSRYRDLDEPWDI